MENTILLYASISSINKITFAAMGMLTGLLTLRAMRDFIEAFTDPDSGLKEAFRKTGRRIFAALIALTITGTVHFIQSFYI